MVGPKDKLNVWVSGAILTLVTFLVVTVTPVVALTLPFWTFTVAVPRAFPVSKPVPLMLATLLGLVLHEDVEVTSPVVLLP